MWKIPPQSRPYLYLILSVHSMLYVVREPEGAVLQEQDLCVQQGSLYNHPVEMFFSSE